jgi:serine/threonine-protein kinase RsbW
MAKEQQIIIPSTLQHIHIIESFLEQLRWDCDIDDCQYGNIHLAVVEAVTNAIMHGNKGDAKKQIVFIMERFNGQLKFCVKDQGKGFNMEQVPDPTLPENKEKLNGRGVFLIKNLADHVDFRDNGATLEMIFNVG